MPSQKLFRWLLNMINDHQNCMKGYKTSTSCKNVGLGADKSEQYSGVRLAMEVIYKMDIAKFGPVRLLNLPDRFNSMDYNSMENFNEDLK